MIPQVPTCNTPQPITACDGGIDFDVINNGAQMVSSQRLGSSYWEIQVTVLTVFLLIARMLLEAIPDTGEVHEVNLTAIDLFTQRHF